MRALLGLMVLMTGCDLLFQIDHLSASDAGSADDGEGPTGMIAITARGTATGAITTSLMLDFGAVAPKPSDMTVLAFCYNNDQLASGAQVVDSHNHAMSHLLTTQTTTEYSELWYGRAEGNVVITFDHPVNGPDVRAVAYSGIDQTAQPVAVDGTVTGSVAVSAGPLPIDAGLSVVVAATCVQGATKDVEGYQMELEANGNWFADLQSIGPDSIFVTATQMAAGQAVLQLAALPAAE